MAWEGCPCANPLCPPTLFETSDFLLVELGVLQAACLLSSVGLLTDKIPSKGQLIS